MVAAGTAQSEQRARIARNTVFNVLRALVGAATGFVTSVVIARGLGPSETGVYTLVNWTAIAATTVVSGGLGFSIARFIAQHDARTERGTIVGIFGFGLRAQLLLALFGAAVVALASGLLADGFDIPGGQTLFALAALLVLFGALSQTLEAPIFGLERQTLLLPITASLGFGLLTAALVVLHVLDSGVRVLISAQVLVLFGVAILDVVLVSRIIEIRVFAGVTRRLRRRIVSYASSLTLTMTLGLVVWQRSEVFILGLFQPAQDVAFYSIAFAMSESLQNIFPLALTAALFPSITRAFAIGDRAFANRAYVSSLRLTAMAVAPVAFAGSLLSVPAIDVLYGREFHPAALPLSVLLFAAAIQRLGYCNQEILLASDHERQIVGLIAGSAAVNLGLALVLIPRWGIAGATIANTSTQLAAFVIGRVLVRRATGFGLPVRGLLRITAANGPVIAAIGLVLVLIDDDLLALTVGVLVVAPAYALGLKLTRALRPEEKRYLEERLRPLLALLHV